MRGNTQLFNNADFVIENGRVTKDRGDLSITIVVDGVLVRDGNGAVEAQRDSVIDAVRADLLQRSQLGIAKYGKTLGSQAEYPLRGKLQHAYEEALDLANYLKWSIIQLDEGKNPHKEAALMFAEQNVRMKQGIREVIARLPVPDGFFAEQLNRVLDEN